MKRAKTRKNLISILLATLGVVFAFITGFTYCISSLTLEYGTHPNSTSAYMANQQYHVINDTVDQPIIFGEGSRNFEIALQYSMPYDFDVRFTYSLSWSGGSSTSNVILHFANRDNIIYDENYIYFCESVTKGDGKIGFITGVDFVNTKDKLYDGQTLTINITNVKIYKKQSSYALNSHNLTKDVTDSVAAQGWINYKNKSTTGAHSYVMMYNSRGKHENGVPYPGLETAYKKPTTEVTGATGTIQKVTAPSWLGGNRAYAGIGMYIITGDNELKMNIEVAGIWRTRNPDTNTGEIIDASPQLISENSIKFNYTDEWIHQSWNELKLWETRIFNFKIPAKSAYYINILDSIEVTSASRVSPNAYDTYRAVINNITINYGLNGTGTDTKATKFEYTEASAEWLSMKEINNNSGLSTSNNSYTKKDVSVVNTSLYSAGLYTAQISKDAEQQLFHTNVSLINNTNQTKMVRANFKLMYLISNGSTVLTDGNGKRVEELINSTFDDRAAFGGNYTYGYSIESTQAIDSVELKLAPYSSMNAMNMFTVDAELQTTISAEFGCDYDVWAYLVVTLELTNETIDTETDENGFSSEKTNLQIEVDWNSTASSAIFSVKNTSTKTIKGFYVKNFITYELSIETYNNNTPLEEDKEPADWAASYWKYFYEKDGVKVHCTSTSFFNSNTIWPSDQRYVSRTPEPYKDGNYTVTLNALKTDFESTDAVIQPGESVTFAKIDVSETKRLHFSGEAYSNKAKTADEISLVNTGKTNAFIINNSDKSYYVRFSGDLTASVQNVIEDKDSPYNYYIGIIRPGQIVSTPLSSSGELDAIEIEADGLFNVATIAAWSDTAKQQMTKYFALIKTTPAS